MSESKKMYSAAIAQGNMYVSEIEYGGNVVDIEDIYATVRADNPVIISTDIDQLEVMAGQMGLAFCPESI